MVYGLSLLRRFARVAVVSLVAHGPLACASAARTPGPAPVTASPPWPLPNVTLTTLDGAEVEVARMTAGHVALVSLWATWCEACQREMDALNRLEASAGPDVLVVGVAVGEPRGTVADFTKRRGLRYVQLVDEHFAFADAIGQKEVPATLVVDRLGRIVFRGEAVDGASLEALRRAAAEARAQRSVPFKQSE